MRIKKLLLTAHHQDKHPDRITGSYTTLADTDIEPFVQAGFAVTLYPAAVMSKNAVESIVQSVDSILITGGDDVDPYEYNEEVLYQNVVRYKNRDTTDRMILDAAIKFKKPVFGYCRGIQIINVYFGGSLYQNVKEQIPTKVLHKQADKHKLCHTIDIEKNSFLYDVYKEYSIWVNSFHSQAIKQSGKGLQVVAKSADNVIEAVQHKDLPVYAVQWHPEISFHFDETSRKLIRYLHNWLL